MKYADDTVIVGLLDDNENSEQNYRSEIESFVKWCEENFLNLNVKKTKEMIIDLEGKDKRLSQFIINEEAVQIVENYKYLGCIIDNSLNGSNHVKKIAKKANQRIGMII